MLTSMGVFTSKTIWVASTYSSLYRRLLLLASTSLVTCVASPAPCQSFEIVNPLIAKRADPHVYFHSDGYYYFTATVPEYDLIELRRATSIQGLSTAATTAVWKRHASGVMAAHIWAPELHYIDGKWYLYFAAGSSTNVWDIRVYVLENVSTNPFDPTWTEKGQLVTNGTTFALDATTFEHNGTRYLVWAEDDPTLEVNTVLFIAPMSNPWTLTQKGVRISKPDYAWERVGYAVNEGPAVLKRNGKIFISYSASATDANYCVGLLTASDTSDLLKSSSWTKSAAPVFKSANGIYGPGHNQFTTLPDGTTDLLVYHGRSYEKITGDPLNDPNRATRVQPLTWNSDGSPNFASPLRDGTITLGYATGGNGATTNTGIGGRGGAGTIISSAGGTTTMGNPGQPTAAGGGSANSGISGAGGATTSSNTPVTAGATSGRRTGGLGGADSSQSSAASGGASPPASRATGGNGGTRASDNATRTLAAAPGTASDNPTGCSCRSAKHSAPVGVPAIWMGTLVLLFRSRRRACRCVP